MFKQYSYQLHRFCWVSRSIVFTNRHFTSAFHRLLGTVTGYPKYGNKSTLKRSGYGNMLHFGYGNVFFGYGNVFFAENLIMCRIYICTVIRMMIIGVIILLVHYKMCHTKYSRHICDILKQHWPGFLV